jgi:hypothetical protein
MSWSARVLVPGAVSATIAATIACGGCNGAAVQAPKPSARTSPGSTAKPPAPPAPVGSNAVALGAVEIPAQMYAGQMAPFYVTVTNTGAATWDDNYRLGAVAGGDAAKFLNDPQLLQIYAAPDRVHIATGKSVVPGATYTFAFVAKAPAAGSYDVKFQLVQDNANAWFGAVAEQNITVGAALAAGTVPTDAIDLTKAQVYNSPPDIATWPATGMVTQFQTQQAMQILFTKRDGAGSWPDYTPPGFQGPIEYTLWSVERINGKWATSGVIQIWRDPSDTLWSGGAPSGLDTNWYYDPGRWGPLSGYQPAVGEPVGFFVSAGNARNNTTPGATSVLERSNVIVIPFPADTAPPAFTTFKWP